MKTLDYLTSDGKKFFEQLEKLVSQEVVAGYKQGNAKEDNGADVYDVAVFNEFGDSKTPPRPFMKQSFEHNEEMLKKRSIKAIQSLYNGQDINLNDLGKALKSSIQDEIESGNFVPNSPVTIAIKGSDTPLINTGTMLNSVEYEIRGKTE